MGIYSLQSQATETLVLNALNNNHYGWVDSGVNLLDPRINKTDVLIRSSLEGVLHILVIASNLEESVEALKLKKKINPENRRFRFVETTGTLQDTPKYPIIESTVGIHPHYADQADTSTFTKIKTLCVDNQVRMIGECGLDFNRNFSTPANQLYAFESQLELAAELGIGVYLHERDAFEQQIALLEKYSPYIPVKVAHCFTGNTEQMLAYLSFDCYIGVTGWICDPKRGDSLRRAVVELPLEKMLLETDSPYLFPKTVRPRKSVNEPSYLPYIANEVANIKKLDLDIIKQHSFNNAYSLFFE